MSTQDNGNSCDHSEPDHDTASNQTVLPRDNQPQTESAVTVSISISHKVESSVEIERLFLASLKNTENRPMDLSGLADNTFLSSTSKNSESESDPPLSQILYELCSDNLTLATKWNATFDTNEPEALRSILQLILQTSGLRLILSSELALNIHHLTIDRLGLWKRECNGRILIKNEMYVNNLTEFLEFALNEKVLTNEEFVGKMRHVIKVMVNSEWNSARETAMVFGSNITNQYLELWMNTERKIIISTLPNILALLKEKLSLLKKIMDSFLKLMMLFLKDRVLKIRKSMFDLLCHWLKDFPKLFVNDHYLRYVYWSLYDVDTNIRASAAHVCSDIITAEEIGHKLDLFIVVVVPTLFLRVNDIKATVAIAALKSLSAINKKLNVFQFESPEKIYRHIFSKRPGVSSTAAWFLYQIIHDNHRSSTSFITEILIFLYECELITSKEYHVDLVKNMLPLARHQLTDWSAWTGLLLSNSLVMHLKQVACKTLSSVIHFSTRVSSTSEDSPVSRYILPSGYADPEKIECETAMKTKQYDVCEKTKTEMTSFFGKVLIQLWNKYKKNPDCLLHLLSIASGFSDIGSMDVREYCAFLLNLECNDPEMSHLKFAILASLCQFMARSQKWKREGETIKSMLFNDLDNELPDVFIIYSTPCSEEVTLVIARNLNVLRSTYCLSKYFDLSHTTIVEQALASLSRSKTQPQPHPEIVCTITNMVMHIIQWHLKNILDGKYRGDELTTSLHKLQSRIRILKDLMEHFIRSTNTCTRRTAFIALCKLLTQFSNKNGDVEHYPMIHLPRPSIAVMEWLNFHLVTEVGWGEIPEDKAIFYICYQTLKHFCTLLSLGVLNSKYIHSILPYFRFYQQRQNYNPILKEAIEELVMRNTFPVDLLQALVLHSNKTHKECEVVARGLCSVALKEVKPVEHRSDVTTSIIKIGVGYTFSSKNLSFLMILSPIVKLVPKNELIKLKDVFREIFDFLAENNFVKHFLAALKK